MPRMAVLALLVAAVIPSSAVAQSNHRDVVYRQLDTVTVVQAASGYVVDSRVLTGGTMAGLLPKGAWVTVEVELAGSTQYFIAAGCDRDCKDLDLKLYGLDGTTVVAEDVGDDDVPIVSLTTGSGGGGRHLLTISMATCTTDRCWFGARVFKK